MSFRCTMIREYLDKMPTGYTEVYYSGSRYGVSKEVFNQGRSFKVYAQELGGNDIVSLNVYLTSRGDFVRPCEMPAEKVLDFLENFESSNQRPKQC